MENGPSIDTETTRQLIDDINLFSGSTRIWTGISLGLTAAPYLIEYTIPEIRDSHPGYFFCNDVLRGFSYLCVCGVATATVFYWRRLRQIGVNIPFVIPGVDRVL